MNQNIILYEKAFIGSSVKKPEKYMNKLHKGRLIKNFYLVVFSFDGKNLEIYSAYNFLQKFFREQHFLIVALVDTQDEAFEYIRKISEISFNKYSEFDPYKTVMNMSDEEYDDLCSKQEDDE